MSTFCRTNQSAAVWTAQSAKLVGPGEGAAAKQSCRAAFGERKLDLGGDAMATIGVDVNSLRPCSRVQTPARMGNDWPPPQKKEPQGRRKCETGETSVNNLHAVLRNPSKTLSMVLSAPYHNSKLCPVLTSSLRDLLITCATRPSLPLHQALATHAGCINPTYLLPQCKILGRL